MSDKYGQYKILTPAGSGGFGQTYVAEKANDDVEGTAEIIASLGIVEKAPVAAKALPACNIVYMDDIDMKMALEGYLNALYELDPSSVGGALPTDDFYYTEFKLYEF